MKNQKGELIPVTDTGGIVFAYCKRPSAKLPFNFMVRRYLKFRNSQGLLWSYGIAPTTRLEPSIYVDILFKEKCITKNDIRMAGEEKEKNKWNDLHFKYFGILNIKGIGTFKAESGIVSFLSGPIARCMSSIIADNLIEREIGIYANKGKEEL